MAKENNTPKIYEAMLNRLDKISSKEEIEEIIDEFNKKFKKKVNISNSIKYLSRHNYIKKIFLGFYYINSLEERKRKYCKFQDKELLFLVLNKLNIKWYLGLSSALYESGKSWQTPALINIINNRISGKRKILGINVIFFKIKEELIFATKQAKSKNNLKYFYSIPAKTYLDMVYLRTGNKLIKNEESKKYLKKFPKWVEKKLT